MLAGDKDFVFVLGDKRPGCDSHLFSEVSTDIEMVLCTQHPEVETTYQWTHCVDSILVVYIYLYYN